jgi:hypothetical protein
MPSESLIPGGQSLREGLAVAKPKRAAELSLKAAVVSSGRVSGRMGLKGLRLANVSETHHRWWLLLTVSTRHSLLGRKADLDQKQP